MKCPIFFSLITSLFLIYLPPVAVNGEKAYTEFEKIFFSLFNGGIKPFKLSMKQNEAQKISRKNQWEYKKDKKSGYYQTGVGLQIYHLYFNKNKLYRIGFSLQLQKKDGKNTYQNEIVAKMKEIIKEDFGRPFSSGTFMNFSFGKMKTISQEKFLGKGFILVIKIIKEKYRGKSGKNWFIEVYNSRQTNKEEQNKYNKPRQEMPKRYKKGDKYGESPLRGI